jgi:microcystin-dependent protein
MDTSLINNISTLTSSVSTVSTNLSTEITNRTSAISSEATARTTADGVLQAAITAEESSRIAQDTILANNINTFAPTGAVAYFATKTPSYQPPTGWLECDGSSGLSTTGLYASLFAVIGYTFGGAGAVFSIPDLRGEFIRGWNRAGTGLDPGRAFGSSQTDSLKDHTHTYNAMTVRSGNPYGGASLMYDTIPVATASSSATPSGAETRPHNVALLACIKY